MPRTVAAWEARRAALRTTLLRLLGELPPPFTPAVTVLATTQRAGYTVERIAFDNGLGATVYGYVVVPAGRVEPGPAIVFQHYHAGRYAMGKEELFDAWPTATTPADAFAEAGYVVVAIDAYGFGERQHQGPADEREAGAATEMSLVKRCLWEGQTLWGLMVRDDMLALNYLLSRADVDPARVGTTGHSMGATRAWWLAALDDRIAVTVPVGCLTHYQTLVKERLLWFHSIYYYVPNILAERIDMDEVVASIAPRPLLTLTGDRDDGSPVEGVTLINDFTREVYALYGAEDRFRGVIYPGVGHEYTAGMWGQMLAWFERHL